MKNFRSLCLALLLTAAFAVPALAGDMQGPGSPSNPPSSTEPGDTQGPSVLGETQGPGMNARGDIGSPGVSILGDISTPGVAAILFAISSAF